MPFVVWPLARRFDGDELEAELLGPLEEPVQVRLVDHGAGQHRVTCNQVHRHPLEQEAELPAQLSAKNQPVPSASSPVAIHHAYAHTQPGDLSPPAGGFHLGEARGRKARTAGPTWSRD